METRSVERDYLAGLPHGILAGGRWSIFFLLSVWPSIREASISLGRRPKLAEALVVSAETFSLAFGDAEALRGTYVTRPRLT